MAKAKSNGNGKLTEEQFVTNAIKNLRKGTYRGIHTRFSGFNEAFRNYYGTDPVVATQRLAEQSVITIRPCKGGVMIYLAGEAPATQAPGEAALVKILS